jgi:DNA-binding NtrC family response regulator
MMKILVVDDDTSFTNKESEWLEIEGYQVIKAYSEVIARKILTEFNEIILVALIDMRMESEDSGLNLVKLIKARYPWIVTIIVTANGNLENAARCMENGCFSYIIKGETPPALIRQTLKKAIEQNRYIVSIPRLRAGLTELFIQFTDFSLKMGKQIEQISNISQRIEDEFSLLEEQCREIKE